MEVSDTLRMGEKFLIVLLKNPGKLIGWTPWDVQPSIFNNMKTLRYIWEENYKEGIETSFKTHISSVSADLL